MWTIGGRQEEEHAPLYINGSVVEKVSCFRFLGVNISNDLTWSAHTDKVVKAARKRLFYLRGLKKFDMDPVILTNFYRCTIESILTGCITVWYGSCTAKDRKVWSGLLSSSSAGDSQPCRTPTTHEASEKLTGFQDSRLLPPILQTFYSVAIWQAIPEHSALNT